MTVTTDSALKEWDAQVRALESGRASVLVRKGGIVEPRRDFEVEHREFLFYPTFLHQNPGELRDEFQDLLRDDPAPGTVELRAFARVEGVWRVENLERARSLEGVQALTAAAIERRFEYRGKPWVHALLLRVYALPEAVRLEETPAFAGCVSWVPLGESVRLDDLRPVLDDAAFAAARREIEARLG